LRTSLSVTTKEKENAQKVLGARVERKKGKRIALKGKVWISTPEILQMVEAAEAESSCKTKSKGRGKGPALPLHISDSDLQAVIAAQAYEEEEDIDSI
jgi:hypothetical protein